MFKSIILQNFKNFSNLSVDNLERVNLITGKNNSGKSALLEALFMNTYGCDTRSMFVINGIRGEGWSNQLNDRPLRGFFHDFDVTKPIEIMCSWQDSATGPVVNRLLKITELKSNASNISNANIISGLDFKFRRGSQEYLSSVGWSEEKISQIQPAGQGVFSPKIDSVFHLKFNDSSQVPVIKSFFNHSAPRESVLYTYGVIVQATKEKKLDKLINLVKLIDRRVEGLVPLSENNINQIYVDIGEKNLIPISMMGSGFSNILQIACALFFSQCKVLFIDEVEDRLYYRAFTKIAKYLIEVATSLDIQLFITTHSGEMISSFFLAAKEIAFSSICALRFDSRKSGVSVTRFNQDDLTSVNMMELDIR